MSKQFSDLTIAQRIQELEFVENISFQSRPQETFVRNCTNLMIQIILICKFTPGFRTLVLNSSIMCHMLYHRAHRCHIKYIIYREIIKELKKVLRVDIMMLNTASIGTFCHQIYIFAS